MCYFLGEDYMFTFFKDILYYGSKRCRRKPGQTSSADDNAAEAPKAKEVVATKFKEVAGTKTESTLESTSSLPSQEGSKKCYVPIYDTDADVDLTAYMKGQMDSIVSTLFRQWRYTALGKKGPEPVFESQNAAYDFLVSKDIKRDKGAYILEVKGSTSEVLSCINAEKGFGARIISATSFVDIRFSRALPGYELKSIINTHLKEAIPSSQTVTPASP